jgi:hypothetical protein
MRLLTKAQRQNLLGSSIFCDEESFDSSAIQRLLDVPQDLPINNLPALPIGFTLHQEAISSDVLLCVQNILALQSPLTSTEPNLTTTEEIQLRIESRLVFQEQSCKQFGVISECCRLAVYIVSYVSDSTTWKSAFVPLRLAEQLLHYLTETMATNSWQYRRDLFAWLLLVGASVGKGSNCLASNLDARYQDLIERATLDVSDWKELKNGPKAVNNVLRRFIYADGWISRRDTLPGWSGFEQAMFLCGPGEPVDVDVDTDMLLQDLLPDSSL